MDMLNSLSTTGQTIEDAIQDWLFEKQNNKTGSVKTRIAYETTMQSFRDMLREKGIDLDGDPQTITQVAKIWACKRAPGAKHEGNVASATYNQRLAIISSFYVYLQSKGVQCRNPIADIEKRKVQAYAEANPLDGDDVAAALQIIDRTTPQGKRDYTLLAVALETGRRANELVGLRWQHVQVSGKKVILSFDHCKGGKKMRDALDVDTARVFLDYLHTVYGSQLANLSPDAPVWVSFSKQNKGKAISTHTLNDICEQYLGTSKIHSLRHTFAAEMEKAGATLSEIQHRLGHENITTTSIYLKAVRSADNPYAGRLSARFGIGKD